MKSKNRSEGCSKRRGLSMQTGGRCWQFGKWCGRSRKQLFWPQGAPSHNQPFPAVGFFFFSVNLNLNPKHFSTRCLHGKPPPLWTGLPHSLIFMKCFTINLYPRAGKIFYSFVFITSVRCIYQSAIKKHQ